MPPKRRKRKSNAPVATLDSEGEPRAPVRPRRRAAEIAEVKLADSACKEREEKLHPFDVSVDEKNCARGSNSNRTVVIPVRSGSNDKQDDDHVSTNAVQSGSSSSSSDLCVNGSDVESGDDLDAKHPVESPSNTETSDRMDNIESKLESVTKTLDNVSQRLLLHRPMPSSHSSSPSASRSLPVDLNRIHVPSRRTFTDRDRGDEDEDHSSEDEEDERESDPHQAAAQRMAMRPTGLNWEPSKSLVKLIKRGMYVHLPLLLDDISDTSISRDIRQSHPASSREASNKVESQKRISNITDWLQAMDRLVHVMAPLLVERTYLEADLFRYKEFIIGMARTHPFYAVYDYDVALRASRTKWDIPWANADLNLSMIHLLTAITVSNSRVSKVSTSDARKPKKNAANGVCRNWNEGKCTFPRCSRAHVCSHCQADHKVTVCPKTAVTGPSTASSVVASAVVPVAVSGPKRSGN